MNAIEDDGTGRTVFQKLALKLKPLQSHDADGGGVLGAVIKTLSITSTDHNNNSENNNNEYHGGSKSHISRRIAQMYNLQERKEKLKSIIDPNIKHAEIIKLLIRLRLKVYLKIDLDDQLTCFGKLKKLIYDI